MSIISKFEKIKKVLREISVHRCSQQYYLQQSKGRSNPSVKQVNIPQDIFGLTKRGNSDTWYNMNGACRHYAKWSEPVTKDKEGGTGVPRARGRGIGSYCLGRTEFLRQEFWSWRAVMVARQRGCHWTVHLKMVKRVNFMLCAYLCVCIYIWIYIFINLGTYVNISI